MDRIRLFGKILGSNKKAEIILQKKKKLAQKIICRVTKTYSFVNFEID